MVPTFCKVSVCGNIGVLKPIEGDRGKFYELKLAVKRSSPTMRPDGETMDADWYKVVTNADCSKLKVGQYVAVEGRMVVRYWTKDATPTKNFATSYEIRADKVNLVEDDTKKKATMTPPAVGKIMSSSLG